MFRCLASGEALEVAFTVGCGDDAGSIQTEGRGIGQVLVAASAVHSTVDTHLNAGFEWHLNPLLTVRAGLRRLPGDDAAVGSSSLGLTLRPMRTRHLQFHYAYTTDEVDAGARNVAGLSVVFR